METQYPLVLFTLFLCLASGLLGFQGWLLFKGEGTRRFHIAMLIASFASLCVGGVASFMHLHHWERLFNGFMHIGSGITQELVGIVVTCAVILALFLLIRRGKADEGRLVSQPIGIVVLVVAVVMGFVCAHSYDMPARPAWHNVGLYLYYYSSEFLLGAAGTWVLAACLKQDGALLKTLAKATGIAGIVSAVIVVACGLPIGGVQILDIGPVFHTTEPTLPALDAAATMSAAVSGTAAGLFWGGAVLVGSVACAALGFWSARKPASSPAFASVALACALIGGFCYRVALYAVAMNFYPYF